MRLSELAPSERPRERMLREGPGASRPDELLAVILGTGRGSGEDALELATRVLDEGGGIAGLASRDLAGLTAIRGLGPVKATRIAAAFELGRRAEAPAVAEPPADASAPMPDEPPPVPAWRTVGEAMRGQVAIGEKALLAYRLDRLEAPVTLALGQALGEATRAGAVLARLLASAGSGPWHLVAVRGPGAPRVKERDACERLLAASRLVDLPIESVVLMAGLRAYRLDEDEGEEVAP